MNIHKFKYNLPLLGIYFNIENYAYARRRIQSSMLIYLCIELYICFSPSNRHKPTFFYALYVPELSCGKYFILYIHIPKGTHRTRSTKL